MTPKVVVVTGGSRGIGAAVARQLAARGHRLALLGLEPDELAAVAEDCGVEVCWWEVDVTDAGALGRAVDQVVTRYGRIDAVVVNAGIAAPGFSRSMDPDVWERVVEVDLLGVWRTVHAALPRLVEHRGYLLLVSSLAAVVQLPGLASYNVAKAGVEALGNSLRAELRHLGVAVGIAHLSFVDTDMVRGTDEHPVFGPARSGLPLLNRVYPVELAADRLVRGVESRARVVHVPAWIGVLKAVRWLLPRLVELGARFTVPAADAAALDDIARRGRTEASRPVGAGGRADTARASSQ